MTQQGIELGMQSALGGLASRGFRPDVIYDIGASDGSWTRFARTIWPKSRYVCFEPLEERRAPLEKLRREDPGAIELQFVGLGDEEAMLSLGVSETLWESSFAYAGKSARSVKVRRLDNMFEEKLIPRPTMMKLDIQGFERRALRGAGKLIEGVEVILMECNFFSFCDEMVTLDQTIDFMSKLNFVPYEFLDFMRRPLDGAMGQCDIVFVRRDHRLLSDRRWV